MTADHTPAGRLLPTLDALVDEAKALRADLDTAEIDRRRASAINLTATALLAALVVLLLLLSWQTNRVGHEAQDTNKRIADCTTVGGKCYEETRARTGGAVQNIIRAELFMAECARLYPSEAGPAYDQKLEACVAERLAGPRLLPQSPAGPSKRPGG